MTSSTELEIAGLGLWDYHLTTDLVIWSKEMYDIFGATADTLPATLDHCLQRIHPDDIDRVKREMEAALRGEPYRTEYRMNRLDGEERIVASIGQVLQDEQGCPIRFYGVLQDITERKREKQRLRDIEAQYDLISENVRDIISYSSPDGTLRYVSPAVLTMLGYEPEEIIGSKTAGLFHPDDLQDLFGRRYQDEDMVTCRVRHKDGHYVWYETTIKLIRDEAGVLTNLVGVGRDISGRMRTEQELRAAKDQLEAFIDCNGDAILFFDFEGRVLRVNSAYEKMFGWSFEEVLEVGVANLPQIPDYLRAEVEEMSEQVRSGQAILGKETVRMTRDGRMVDVLLSVSLIHGPNGQVSGWSTIMRDITEQKQAARLLLQSEKLSIAGELAAGIAHEIRNPLTALRGFTQLMKMEAAGKYGQYLTIMEEELSRIEVILSELLVLAKPQAEKYVSEDLALILRDVASLLDTQAILHNIELLYEIEEGLPLVSCDKNQLKQVFINFLKNSIEAMKQGGPLRIRAERTEQGVKVRIIDRGIGISAERLKRIGEPFYTTKEKGTGLGLMVSKKIIESHCGTFRIQSEVGVGTEVEVVLPRG